MDSRAFGGLSRPIGSESLIQDHPAHLGVLLQEDLQLFGDDVIHQVRISLLPNFDLVWPSNWASVSLTEMTQVRPSRQSSPETFSSSFSSLIFRP